MLNTSNVDDSFVGRGCEKEKPFVLTGAFQWLEHQAFTKGSQVEFPLKGNYLVCRFKIWPW